MTAIAAPLSCCLPNGLTVFSLNKNDTITVYNDIFNDDCYRMHGVTIKDGDCILDVGANTGLFILFLNKIGAKVRVYAFEPAPASLSALKALIAAADAALGAALDGAGVQAAVDKIIVRGDAALAAGAEVAFLPAMSGG